MRMIVIGLAAALLAGCGGLVQIDEGNGAGPAAGGPGGGDGSKPSGQGGPAAPGGPGTGRNTREATIAACVRDLGRSLPRGTDVPRLCGCAVDRMIARTPQNDAVRQCAAEQNVRVPGL
jgi:hypothetical protein